MSTKTFSYCDFLKSSFNYFILYFQLVTTNEKLEMQIRNLNSAQSNSPNKNRNQQVSEKDDSESQENLKNVENVSNENTSTLKESGKANFIRIL